MKRFRWMANVVSIGAAIVLGGSVTAQESIDLSAAVHAGICEQPGELVTSLDPFRIGRGQEVGVTGVPVVLESSTDDINGVSGQQLVDAPHIVAVFQGEAIIACGAVGGVTDDDDLTLALSPVEGSGVFGIATIEDIEEEDDDDLEIDLLVVRPVS